MIRGIPIVVGAFVALSCAPAFPAQGQAYYVFDDLGTLPGHDQSMATDINDAKQVAGMSSSTSENRAVLWAPPGPMVALSPSGNNQGSGLNALGQVAGSQWTTPNSDSSGFLWTSPGPLTTLGTLGAGKVSAVKLNASGQIIGFAASGSATVPTLWSSPAAPVGLGSLGGDWGQALDVNASGVVVGASKGASGPPHAFSWTQNGGMKKLAELTPNNFSQASSINAGGQIVGYAYVGAKDSFQHAVLWPSATSAPLDLGVPGGLTSWANDINDDGVIVGLSGGNTAYPFRRDANGTAKLEVPPGLLGVSPNAINNNGDIAGTIVLPSNKQHAVVWWRYTVSSPYSTIDRTLSMSGGTTTLTILGGPTQVVSQLDPATITLGNGVLPEAHGLKVNGVTITQYADVNLDGLPDLSLQFDVAELTANADLTLQTSKLWLQGASLDRLTGMTGSENIAVTP